MLVLIAVVVAILATTGVTRSSLGARPALMAGIAAAQERPEDVLCEDEFNTGVFNPGEATPVAEPAAPETGIVTVPPGRAGIVAPAEFPERRLYPAVIVLPPGACVPFHEVAGALVLFVQEGTVDYIMHAEGSPPPEVQSGHMNAQESVTDVPSDTLVRLGPGGWVTQDRQVWFTYRNAGYADAVVTVAALVDPAGGVGACNGGCRKG
jgi:hypothetical protein